MAKIIPLLTDPEAHGGKAKDAFDVVVPSLPGYGFSDRPRARGMHPSKVAELWVRLMAELGYRRFAAQGGDWGATVSTALGLDHPQSIIGIHLNYIAGRFLLGGTLDQPPEDEAAAAQETDYVNHVFMQQNPGFMVLYSFIKDALLSKVGIVKVWWEEREEEQRETYYDLTDDQFALLAQAVMESGGAMKIVAHTVHNALEEIQEGAARSEATS